MVEAAEDGGYGQVTGCRRVCRRQPARACGRLGVQAGSGSYPRTPRFPKSRTDFLRLLFTRREASALGPVPGARRLAALAQMHMPAIHALARSGLQVLPQNPQLLVLVSS